MPSCNRCGDFDVNLYRSHTHNNNLCNSCLQNICNICDSCGCEAVVRFYSIRRPGNYSEFIEVCEECSRDTLHTCESCHSEVDELRDGPCESLICNVCRSELACECSDCGMPVWRDSAHLRDNHWFCHTCRNKGEWGDTGFFTENPTYSEIRSTRKYGVEFETSSNPDHISIRGDTVFGCKKDGSVDGMEFVSPVLYGDEGLAEIRKLSHHASRLGWEVNSACGFHLHVDLSNDSDEDRFKLLYSYMYTYDLWSRFISRARKENYYCAKHVYTVRDIENGRTNFTNWVEYMPTGPYERYDWVNWRAFLRFNTVELRNHSATLNGEKACNWIKAHTRFIDNVVKYDEADIIQMFGGTPVYDQFKIISEWWDDEDLTEFYLHRAELFHNPIRNEMVLS